MKDGSLALLCLVGIHLPLLAARVPLLFKSALVAEGVGGRPPTRTLLGAAHCWPRRNTQTTLALTNSPRSNILWHSQQSKRWLFLSTLFSLGIDLSLLCPQLQGCKWRSLCEKLHQLSVEASLGFIWKERETTLTAFAGKGGSLKI